MTENEAIERFKFHLTEPLSAFSIMACEAAIKALEEVQQYQVIGTVEECRAAVERMKPKKPAEYEDRYYGCPDCGNTLMHKWEKYPTILTPKSQGLPYCLNCGQAIDWNEKENKDKEQQ